jgi:hypothetical protein
VVPEKGGNQTDLKVRQYFTICSPKKASKKYAFARLPALTFPVPLI